MPFAFSCNQNRRTGILLVAISALGFGKVPQHVDGVESGSASVPPMVFGATGALEPSEQLGVIRSRYSMVEVCSAGWLRGLGTKRCFDWSMVKSFQPVDSRFFLRLGLLSL
jgi:hypothetical protein